MNILFKIKEWFLSGLFLIIPVFVTFMIIKTIITFLSRWFMPLNSFLGNKFVFIYSEIIIAFILITLIGFVFKNILINNIVQYIEKYIIENIPLARSIYSGLKKIVGLIQKKNEIKDEEQMVAWVHLPYKSVYCLGLMTGKLDKDLSPDKNKEYYCFFVPHTPNPMSGYYIVVAEGDFIFTSMTRQEAMSMIISGGIIRPNNK